MRWTPDGQMEAPLTGLECSPLNHSLLVRPIFFPVKSLEKCRIETG
jgi:hypothetical protein